MIGAQFKVYPFMIQGPEYNCSAFMPPGPEWSEKYGVKQIPFGTYSIVFGVITEILYIPCALGLFKETQISCFKIMFWLSILDIIALMDNSIVFGYLLLEGAVYCSNRIMTLGAGTVGYVIWLSASSTCILLGLNRLFVIFNAHKYFSSTRTTVYLAICTGYGIFLGLFTRPGIVNSTLQSMFFTPFIPGHGLEEYVNYTHATHNLTLAVCACLLYITFAIVIIVKTRAIIADRSNQQDINNTSTFVQVLLICILNSFGNSMHVFTALYVYMNFMPVSQAMMIAGHVSWQCIHGLPPFIYLALNQSLRKYALHFFRLERAFDTSTHTSVTSLTDTKSPQQH